MLRSIVAYTGDIRTPFIEAVFDYYTEEVYGSFDQFDQWGNHITHLVAPEITESSQIWPMLKPLYLTIRSSRYDKGDVNFGIAFKCQWDDEHGLGARFVDWKLTDLAGYADV